LYRYDGEMDPAKTIIRKLGGPTAVSIALGVHRTRVSNWSRPRSVGGSDGRIPQNHIEPLLSLARHKGVDLTIHDFFPEAAARAG